VPRGPRSGADVDARVTPGVHPVRELLRSEAAVHEVLLAPSRHGSDELDDVRELAAERGVIVRETSREELDRVGEGVVHQGVAALSAPFAYAGLDALLARAAGEPVLIVALDGVTDPHNLGSIARTAEAVGAHGLIVPARRAVGVTPSAEKSAAGALAHLPVARVPNLARAIGALAQSGLWSIGLDADAGTEISECELLSEPLVLVAGAEGRGLSRLVAERCDALVSLRMRGRVGSLNVSVAVGIALYEVCRAR
jgi:23S rRNA (guanosine2251-2'-O)-methyltransferase